MGSHRQRNARRGSGLVYSTVMMGVLVGFAAFSVDIGRARSAKGELQAASDAAALNAANGLSDNTYSAKAVASAIENKVDGNTIAAAAVTTTPGNWSNSTFTVNGSPRNAVRVQIECSAAKNNKLKGVLAQSIGLSMPDVKALSTVALIPQAPYEWVGTSQVNVSASSASNKITSYDATNSGAGEAKTTLQSNAGITVSGPATINANIKYGTNANVDPSASVSGTVSQITSPTTYPPGSQVANLTGVTPVYATTYDLNITTNQTLPGGTYVIKNCNVSDCNVTFTGPATIVLTGNVNFSRVAINTSGNLPTNLKFIATVPGTAINITDPVTPLYADFYAPGSNFNYVSNAGYKEMRGRGVFQTLNVSGPGAAMWYDRSLTASSMSKKAVLVK